MERIKKIYSYTKIGAFMSVRPHPDHIKAGKIAARVMRELKEEIKPGAKVLDLCTKAEKKIIEYGGRPAFPCTVSIDNIVAHYTSPPGDKTVIPDSGLVKLDLGANVDGYLSDVAETIDLDGTLEGFVAATDDALEEAIQLLQPGMSLGDIGKKIENVIKAYGLKPIKNLTGHDMKRYRLHAGKRIPNVKERGIGNVELGDCFAIEPYATNGEGTVIESDMFYIFSNTAREEILKGATEKLRLHLREKYESLPFTIRWIGTTTKNIDVVKETRELLKVKAIRGHPVQISKKGRPVSQSEHTVFVSDDGPIVLTKED
ncbi:MAG: type II methionyl aminopeptidase [Candidatus Thorarchaeota archaeon]